MNKEDYFDMFNSNFAKVFGLIEKENREFTNDFNPFSSFEKTNAFGIPTQKSIMVHITDKYSRLERLINNEAAVKSETIESALLDLISYSNKLLVYLQNEKKPKEFGSKKEHKGFKEVRTILNNLHSHSYKD